MDSSSLNGNVRTVIATWKPNADPWTAVSMLSVHAGGSPPLSWFEAQVWTRGREVDVLRADTFDELQTRLVETLGPGRIESGRF